MTTITKNSAGQKPQATEKPAASNAPTKPDPAAGGETIIPDATKVNPVPSPDDTTAGDKAKAAAAEKVRKEEKERLAKEAAEVEKARKEAEAQTKKLAPYKEIAQRYAAHYPACGEFHITSDKMVFLEGDKAEAEAHQRELPKGEVITIKPE